MDLVQYKLQTIDQRKAGFRGLLDRAMESKPLVFCVIGLMSGIVVERYASTGIGGWLVLLAITAIVGLPTCLLSKHSRRPIVAAVIAMLAFTCLGGIRLVNTTRIDQRDISWLVSHDGMIADLRGRIAGNIHIENRTKWEFGEFQRKDPSSGFDMDILEARCTSGWEKITGRVRVSVGEPVNDLKAGDSVQVYTTLSGFREAMNPGEFDKRSFYEGQGLRVAALVKSRAGIEPWLTDRIQQSNFRRFQQWLRDAAMGRLKWGRVEEDESDGMLEALLLGARSDITSQTYEAFRRTGLLHYVSLSGMHIGIVIAAVWQFARVAGVTRRKRAAICILAIIVFLILVPAQSPILRAGVIGLVFCAAVLVRREGNSINTLAFAAIIILLYSPLELFSIGWQLSFGCVLGILLFSSRFEFVFYEVLSRLRRQNLSPDDLQKGIGLKFLRAAVALMATGLAAWMGGAGLMLYHFYNITPLASLWTAITSPLMAAIMVLGYLKIVLSAILPTLGAILAPVVSMLSWAFIESVKLMAQVGASEIVIGHVAIWVGIFYYAAILYLPVVNWPRRGVMGVIALAMPAVLVISIGMVKWQRMYPTDAEFTCLSVGHGQTAVANLPGGSFLFDCGSISLKDCGRRTVLPFLRWQGSSGPSSIFLSHGDTDHCNGIPEIMAGCRPEAVFVSGLFETDVSGYGKDKVLHHSIGTAFHKVNAGDSFKCGQAVITTLWPAIGDEAVRLDNDKSLVTMIDFAGRRILISSDIQQYAQKQILAKYPDLRADVVIAPHHGSVASRYKGFIEALKPEAVIYSCDDIQRERVLKANAAHAEAKTYFTSRDGAVTVRIGTDGSMSISTFAGAHKKGARIERAP